MKKRGQIKLSFGMIFSLILIIIFFSFGFYAINKFLDTRDKIKIADFAFDLQKDIDKMWSMTSEGSQPVDYDLPSRVDYVCFADLDLRPKGNYESFMEEFEMYPGNNLFLYPIKKRSDQSAFNIKNIDLVYITNSQNPTCFKVDKVNNEVKFTLKDFGEDLIKIK